ncbi:MAG TPA: hypothetical protein VJK07_02145 [Candidatus Nanoarchaeia archaeon]|nr:hypothetical protein [Candidatus Nanoarchaeia archaeon]
MTETAQTRYPVIRVRTEIDFLHEGKTLTAVHPFYGPKTAKVLRDIIRANAGQREPTAPEAISFLDALYGGEHAISQEAMALMYPNYFRGFTGIVRDDANDLISCLDFPEFNADGSLDRSNLLARVAKGEAGIRTVPISKIQTGYQKPTELAKNPFVCALSGAEGAEKVARLADRHPKKEAHVWIPEVGELPVVRIAALGSGGYGGFYVFGDGGGLGRGGYAFGVLNSREADAPKK